MEKSPDTKEPKGAIFFDEDRDDRYDEIRENPLRKNVDKADIKTEKHPPKTRII